MQWSSLGLTFSDSNVLRMVRPVSPIAGNLAASVSSGSPASSMGLSPSLTRSDGLCLSVGVFGPLTFAASVRLTSSFSIHLTGPSSLFLLFLCSLGETSFSDSILYPLSAYRPHLPVELFQVFSVYHIASNSPHSPPPRDIPALCTRHERLARACFRSPLPAFALSVYAFYLHVPWNSIQTTGHLLTRPTWRGRAPPHAADGHCQRAAFPLWVRAPASHQPVSTEGPGLRGVHPRT